MNVPTTIDAGAWLSKYLEGANGDTDLARSMLGAFAEAIMSAQASMQCHAAYGERSPERENSRNGYRTRPWDTRVGTIELAVPKLRRGVYSPEVLLSPRRRAEQALVAVICQAYVEGVSTRRVDDLVKAMGIEGREVRGFAPGRRARHHRHPVQGTPVRPWALPLLVDRRPDPAGERRWSGRQRLGSLRPPSTTRERARSLASTSPPPRTPPPGRSSCARSWPAGRGVELVISDAHGGIKAAIAQVLSGASWQRCRTHFMANLATRCSKASWPMIATLVRQVFDQPDRDSTWAKLGEVTSRLTEAGFLDQATYLLDAADDILAFSAFPFEHWKKIRSNNPQERLNKEIRRLRRGRDLPQPPGGHPSRRRAAGRAERRVGRLEALRANRVT